MIDFDTSDLAALARRFHQLAADAEERADQWEDEWGNRLVTELRAASPDDTGFLDSQTRQVGPGEITFGDADYWVFLNYGTVHMAPRDFVGEAVRQVRRPAVADAAQMVRRWL